MEIYCGNDAMFSQSSPSLGSSAEPKVAARARRAGCRSLGLARVHDSAYLAMARPLFGKLLIANRGEIACRVMRTAQRLGIKTVGLYSDPDALTPHVTMADEAVSLGGISSADTYLRVDKVLAAMKATGANAVHPGCESQPPQQYNNLGVVAVHNRFACSDILRRFSSRADGFLSENADFSAAVAEAGAAFVGPNAHAISAMGDKIESKRLAAAAGVSTIPGIEAVLKNADEAVEVANQVGYPVMLKASAGGGGKGMRIAYNDEEARSGFALSAVSKSANKRHGSTAAALPAAVAVHGSGIRGCCCCCCCRRRRCCCCRCCRCRRCCCCCPPLLVVRCPRLALILLC